MSELAAKRVLLITFLLSLAAITYYDLKGQGSIVTSKVDKKTGITSLNVAGTGKLPDPREYVSAGIVFSLLGVLAVASPPLAAALGAGTVLGIASSRAAKAAAGTPAGGGTLAGVATYGPTAPLTVTSPGDDGSQSNTGARPI